MNPSKNIFSKLLKFEQFCQFLDIFSGNMVSLRSKNAFLLRKNFYWIVSFCDPQIEGAPRSAISIQLVMQLAFFQKYKTQFFHSSANQKTSARKKV